MTDQSVIPLWETRHMQLITTRHGPVAVHEQGAGDPVLLLHANPGESRDFDAVTPTLSERYRTIAVDFPGYGQSPPPAEPRSASAMVFAEVAQDVVSELRLPPAMLIGNSVGGYAAARLAIDRPDAVKALVLVDTGGFTRKSLKTSIFCTIKGSEKITRRIAGRFARSYLRKRTPHVQAILDRTDEGAKIPHRVAVDAAVWRSFTADEHDLRDRAAVIACPTLLAFGRYDPVLPAAADGETARKSIPGSRLVVFETGHMPFAEDPQAFLATVLPFLEEVRSR